MSESVKKPGMGGKWFTEMSMGKNITNYDSMLVLTHFKGHTMGGFGAPTKTSAFWPPPTFWSLTRPRWT